MHPRGPLSPRARWLTDGPQVGRALSTCYSLGQAPGWLECTQNQRRTFQVSTELVCWSSAHVRWRLLGIKQQQVRVDSKRTGHLAFERWTLHGKSEYFTTRMASTKKKTVAKQVNSIYTFCFKAFAPVLVSALSLLQAQISSVVRLPQPPPAGAGPLVTSCLQKRCRNVCSFLSTFSDSLTIKSFQFSPSFLSPKIFFFLFLLSTTVPGS